MLNFPLSDPRIMTTFEQQNGFDLWSNLVMACHVGSISHGTHLDTGLDDIDIFYVAFPSPERKFGLRQWEHWTLKHDELDVVVYSFDKYVNLLVKSNPNVIGTLWLRPELYMFHSSAFNSLLAHRELFSSLEAYSAFCGYAFGMLKKLENGAYKGYMGEKRKELVKQFGYDPKNASHLVRLYRMGIEFVETGILNVYREHDRQELIDIKQGKWTLDQVKNEAAKLETRMKVAKETSSLPKKPDVQKIDKLLVHLYMNHYRLI
jgi:predicted nucleotidyltransferase